MAGGASRRRDAPVRAGCRRAAGVAPACIDWAALSAIAGDHSCSSTDMLDTRPQTDWILVVADVAAQLKEDLARIPVAARPDEAGGVDGARRRQRQSQTRRSARSAQRAAHCRHPAAARRPAVCDARRLQHRPLPAPAPDTDRPAKYGKLTLQPGSESTRSASMAGIT